MADEISSPARRRHGPAAATRPVRPDRRHPHEQLAPDATAAIPDRRSTARLLLEATRPRQWVKNVLVFAAPGAAGLLGHPSILARTALAALLFLAASAGVYLVNDVIDAPADRLHPLKRLRPVASGQLSAQASISASVGLLATALAGAAASGGYRLALVIAAYATISISYSLALKRVAVVELACVASGFVLRAVAGGAALHLAISPWFVLVTSSGALLVVAGKRSAELTGLGARGREHRAVLALYPLNFLRSVRAISASVAVAGYALWAFDGAAHLDLGRPDGDNVLFQLSILPFVIGILSLELSLEAGRGGAPEELALKDRSLQLLGLAWLCLVALGIYT